MMQVTEDVGSVVTTNTNTLPLQESARSNTAWSGAHLQLHQLGVTNLRNILFFIGD